MENRQIIVSKKDGIQTNHRRLLSQITQRKQNSYKQVIHIKLWITFLHKTIDSHLFMCYNINIIKQKTKYTER